MAREVYDEGLYYEECEALDGTHEDYERLYDRLVSISKRLGYRRPRKVTGLSVATQYVAPRERGKPRSYTDRHGEPIINGRVAPAVRTDGEESPAMREARAWMDYSLLERRQREREREAAIDATIKENWFKTLAGKGEYRPIDGTELTTEELLGPNMLEEELRQDALKHKQTVDQ